MTEKGDLLVDTSKTQLASMTFVCRAVNGERTHSVLIYLMSVEFCAFRLRIR